MKLIHFQVCDSCHGLRVSEDGHSPCANCKGKGITKQRKFRNIKKRIDGIIFDSIGEGNRYCELKLMEKGGIIRNLEIKPCYKMIINNQLICKYYPDYRYELPSGKQIVEDWKGRKTEGYKLKKNMMYAIHGIEIYESGKKKGKVQG
jgi:hypothetical protein